MPRTRQCQRMPHNPSLQGTRSRRRTPELVCCGSLSLTGILRHGSILKTDVVLQDEAYTNCVMAKPGISNLLKRGDKEWHLH